MLLTTILKNSAQQYAALPALTMRIGFRTSTLTYEQVYQYAQAVARLLAANNVHKGDRVIICGPNSPYWICAWWGCQLRGAIAVPLAHQYTQAMFDKVIAQTEPVFFFSSFIVQLTIPAITSVKLEQLPQVLQPYLNQTFDATLELAESDLVELMYTSGTTGEPKGVMLTHANIASNIQALHNQLKLNGPRERLLSILPLSHMLEQVAGFLLPFSIGAHVVYAHSPAAIGQLLNKYRVTKMIAVPEFLKLMAAKMEARFQSSGTSKLFKRALALASKLPSHRMRRMLFYPLLRKLGGKLDTMATGGSALDQDLELLWEALGIQILQGYGLTETAPLISTNTYDEHRYWSVGKPMPINQVRFSELGEIQVKGQNVFQGYYKNPIKTAETFTDDGWFCTGDIGQLDHDGFLFLKGRKKYMIKGAGAQNIFPEDIEAALNSVAVIKDSCVLGLDKAHGNVEIHAVLLLEKPIADVESLINQANKMLAVYQHITGWTVWQGDDFPRSITKKIKREEVAQAIKAHVAGQPELAVQATQKTPLLVLLAQTSHIPIEHITPTTQLGKDLKFDSLMRVELVSGVEELYGVVLDESMLTPLVTVEQIEAMIAAAKPVPKMPLAAAWPRAWWAVGMRRVLLALLCAPFRWFFRLKVEGLENITSLREPVLMMPNHVSLLDGAVVNAALPLRIAVNNSFAAGHDVLYHDYRWASVFVELVFNAFPFPRREEDPIRAGLLNIGTMLDSGCHVTIFPEGHLSLDGSLQPLKKGAGMLALAMNVPIVPIKIKNLVPAVPYDSLFPTKRATVTVVFGKPMRFGIDVTPDEVIKKIAEAIAAL
jgi:long-chain acyl-CoA synthetase